MSLARRLMKNIPVEEAVGTVLCHDITRIVPGEAKGPLFRKGHIVTLDDIPDLLRVGKEHLYVYEPHPGILHENEAARRLATAATGRGIRLSAPSEGRINFHAAQAGLLRVDVEGLTQVNSLGDMALATLHTLQEVHADQPVGGTRIIPLLIEERRIEEAVALMPAPLVEVLPMATPRVGLVTTGSEIYHGRIEDAFGPVLKRKFAAWNCPVVGQRFTSDDTDLTASAIRAFVDEGAGLVAVTGGMSVDPDDRTPAAIRQAGARVVSYGAPTFPGAMFMLAYLGEVPVLGLPGCVMYHQASIFDLLVPRLLAGLAVSAADVARLGHGGFCAACSECRYPICPYGKG